MARDAAWTAPIAANDQMNTEGDINSLPRIDALDGLRGVAILLVVLHNTEHFQHSDPFFVRLIADLASAGWIGVQLFFVLSGYLITRILLQTKSSPDYYRSFFGRRVLRIFPLYFAVLIIALIFVPMVFPNLYEPHRAIDQIWLWTFLINWAHPLGAYGFGLTHFWSLAVEEQFYLLWPSIVKRSGIRHIIKIALYTFVLALGIRIVMRAAGADWSMVYEFTITRMDALIAGAAAAAWQQREIAPGKTSQWIMKQRLIIAVIAGLLGAALTGVYSLSDLYTQTLGYSLLDIVFAFVILAVTIPESTSERVLQSVLCWPVLRTFGKYSYGFYVIHYPIAIGMQRWIPNFRHALGPWAGIAFVFSVAVPSFIAAVGSFHLFEKHFLDLRSRFPARRTASAAAA